jgi:hypothetical protein
MGLHQVLGPIGRVVFWLAVGGFVLLVTWCGYGRGHPTPHPYGSLFGSNVPAAGVASAMGSALPAHVRCYGVNT